MAEAPIRTMVEWDWNRRRALLDCGHIRFAVPRPIDVDIRTWVPEPEMACHACRLGAPVEGKAGFEEADGIHSMTCTGDAPCWLHAKPRGLRI